MAAIARRLALSILNSLDNQDATLDSLLSKAFGQRPKMMQPDRALATELVFGVLRWRGRLDWVIKDLSDTPLHKIDPPVLNILRLGLYQILFLSRIPVSAAVNDAVDLGKKIRVFADETRPLLQGARLTTWELMNAGIEVTLICDDMAAFVMQQGLIDCVMLGADRIAANGDTANKIGTYEKAVIAHENDIPFYVAAPSTTIDLKCPSGDRIPIEDRSEEEVLGAIGMTDKGIVTSVRIAHKEAHARNPAFDVTPAQYITGIITEYGVSKPEEIRERIQ